MQELIGLVIVVVVIGGAIWYIRKNRATKADAPTSGGSGGSGGKNTKLK